MMPRNHRFIRSAYESHRNYTGDVLNFGLAKEQYAARYPDKADRVKFLIVGDDVAVGRTQGNIVGRRYGPLSSHYSTLFKDSPVVSQEFVLSTKSQAPSPKGVPL